MTDQCHKFIEDLCRKHKMLKHQDHDPKYFRWWAEFQNTPQKPPLVVIGEPTRLTVGHDDVALKGTPMIEFLILESIKIDNFPEARKTYNTTERIMHNFLAYINDAQENGDDEGCNPLLFHVKMDKLVCTEAGPFDDGYFGWRVVIPFNNGVTIEHEPDQWLS